ncbi:MAG: hypothetical protein LRY20_00070 [Acholeplasmataceae bacterium]|nr:hypothetical protein [Acholeplasmataceae bacterium]
MKQTIKHLALFVALGAFFILFIYFILHPDLTITSYINQQMMGIYLIVTVLLNILFIAIMMVLFYFFDKIFGNVPTQEEVISYALIVPMIFYAIVFFYAKIYFISIPVALIGLQTFRLHKYIHGKKSLVSATKLRFNLAIRIILNLWFLTTLIQLVHAL